MHGTSLPAITGRVRRLYVGGRDMSNLALDTAWQVDAVVAALGAASVAPLPPVMSIGPSTTPWDRATERRGTPHRGCSA